MYTVKDVAKIMEVSEHTIRFWAKSGLIPNIKRDDNNVRLFSEEDLAWVMIVKCLRYVGTENKEIKHYIDLCLEGDKTMQERYQIILETKKKALASMEELKNQIEVLNFKEDFYRNLIESKVSFDPWNPKNAQKLKDANNDCDCPSTQQIKKVINC